MRLEGEVAIVTGAGRGIGRGIALRLAREGAHVVVCDISKENSERVSHEAGEINPRGRGFPVAADVSVERDVESVVSEVIGRLARIDILVNNAGILAITPVVEISEGEWDRVLAVNLKGPFLFSKHVAREMIKREKGKIINIASNAGKRGDRFLAHYCASKFGVIGLTQVLAKELGPHHIHVNAVCPGFIETDMFSLLDQGFGKYLGRSPEENRRKFVASVPLGRMGKPEDVASLVAFLASREADYIHGQAINICGGVTPY
ncbi:MAG: SDR family oxidoreductase [Deltaproteobacteria bacterium]|nr:SDR family oxidoreductase [Deltaproteobacteria bacterium]